MTRPVAIVTGASQGLGRALADQLSHDGWAVIADARDPDMLRRITSDMPGVTAIPGDVTDEAHRHQLVAAGAALGGASLVVNSASALGAIPLPPLSSYPLDALRLTFATNVEAPLALIQGLLPQLREQGGRIINITSDAAIEPYPGWGGYGASKAALDQLTAVLAEEERGLLVYAFDPGELRTRMHAEALPEDDPAAVPVPESVVPALMQLVNGQLPSGRFRAVDLHTAALR